MTHLKRSFCKNNLLFKVVNNFNKKLYIKVAPKVEKTEVFRKDWNFANRTYFGSCIMKKYYFPLWTKETAFFTYFYHGVIFYSAELFDCAVNFNFTWTSIYFKHKHKSNIKGAIFELRSSHLFRDQSYKEVLEVKCQVCNFISILCVASVFWGCWSHFSDLFFAELLVT